MSVTLDAYSAVVGRIYEASLDASAWEPALEAMCGFVEASKAALSASVTHERRYDVQVHYGYEPGWIDLLNRKYAALNPLGGAAIGREVGSIQCLSASGLIGAFDGHPMYEEWVKPQQILDLVEVTLDSSVGHSATLTFTRLNKDGVFTAEALQRIALLFPHVRRSVLISGVLRMHRRGEAALAGVIDSLAAGVFILSAQGDILRRNVAGGAMLSARTLVAEVYGRLSFRTQAAERAFVEALGGAAAGPRVLGGKGVSVPLREADGSEFLAHLLPLPPAVAKDDLGVREAKVALFISPAQPDLARALATLTATYNLTAAESRIALAIAEIGSTPMIAETLGVSVTTVRTHLQSLYNKTGARRQSEIVGVLRGFVGPFG